MKIKFLILNSLLALMLLIGCQSENELPKQEFVVAFEKQSYDYLKISGNQEMKLIFSENAQSAGSVVVKILATNATYGVDFETLPKAENLQFEVPFAAGQSQVAFTFSNLIYPFDAGNKKITLSISKINYSKQTAIQGYTTSLISFEKSLGATLLPNLGGPNQQNQVFVDFASEAVTTARRDSWDLGFYGGADFRVCLNGSLYMAAKNLNNTNIDAVTTTSVSSFQTAVAVGTFDVTNINYVDAPSGLITKTAIDAVSDVDAENKVYLINRGYAVGTTTPAAGSVAIAGASKGWMKIRVLKRGETYLLQYASLDASTHSEITIHKNANFNFSFFSFDTQNLVSVEPEKTKWHLGFTVFTNEIAGTGTYGYSDFVISNFKAGVKAYQVNTTSYLYANFTKENVQETLFLEDQRGIGSSWRDVFTSSAFADRFYVLKDASGNYYKVRMLALVNASGLRGYPKLEYKLLL